jgi:signal transduction histidine kinase
MFLVMVWHGRRRLAAVTERLAAITEVQRVSEENLRLLAQQRQFLQDASHELGTPITVALGHAELIERADTDPVVAQDAQVVEDELLRLRRLAARMLLLTSAGNPDFLQLAPVAVEPLVVDALGRWSHAPRRWTLGPVAEATVPGDRDRLELALDALLENAVAHTGVDDRIELRARVEAAEVVLAVADAGGGIPTAELGRIFDRFARGGPAPKPRGGRVRPRPGGRQGDAEAHHGSVRVQSTQGEGSTFEVLLPARTDPPAPELRRIQGPSTPSSLGSSPCARTTG